MAGFSVDGLVSGLDTTSLINSLMQAEAAPQTALKAKVSTSQTVISAYQSVNAKYATLQTSADLLAKSGTWTAVAATSTDPSVSVSVDSTSSAGALSFHVTSTAVGQISVSDAFDATKVFAGYPIDISDSTGTVVGSVTPASGSLTDVVTAINTAWTTTGVKAIAVQVAPGSYRLQLSSSKVGSQSAFSVSAGFAASAGIGLALQDATDAVVHIGPTGGGYDVRSSTNTFTDVLPGVMFTVAKKDVDVSISTAQDPKALADKVQAFVDASNAALTEISKQTSYDLTTKKGGSLLSDSAVRQLASATLSGVSQVVDVGSPVTPTSSAVAGLQTDRYGKLTFDRDKFLALQATDPTQAQALVQGVATRVAAVAKGATDKTNGTLTLAVQGRDALIKDMSTRIDDWDDRLVIRKATLSRQFSAMELALSGMKSQSSWLASQLSSLPTSS